MRGYIYVLLYNIISNICLRILLGLSSSYYLLQSKATYGEKSTLAQTTRGKKNFIYNTIIAIIL